MTRHDEQAKRRWSSWTWVWVAVAALLVIAMAVRHAPMQGSVLAPTAAIAGEAEAAEQDQADAAEIEAWLDALRRPNRRDAFLEAAAHLEDRWDAHEDVAPLVKELLTIPQYSSAAVWRFIGQDLRRVDPEDYETVERLAKGFARFGAAGYAEGLRLELQAYVDRNPAGATEDQRHFLEAIGKPELLEPDEDSLLEVPAVEQHTLAQFIDELPRDLGGEHEQAIVAMLERMAGRPHDVYHPIDRAIGETHDYVALACGRYLWSEQHAPLIRKYLLNRLDRSERYGTAMREMYEKLNAEFPK